MNMQLMMLKIIAYSGSCRRSIIIIKTEIMAKAIIFKMTMQSPRD